MVSSWDVGLEMLPCWDFPDSQWLRLRASTVGGMGSIPGWGTKTPHAAHGMAKNKQINK